MNEFQEDVVIANVLKKIISKLIVTTILLIVLVSSIVQIGG